MKLSNLIYLLLFPILFSNCSKEVNETNVLEIIIDDGDSEALYDMFFEKKKVDKVTLAKLVNRYRTQIREKNLIQVPFRNQIPDFRRKKYGALYVDKDNLLHYSITFKFVEYPDGRKELNFIDFRSSEDDLQSLKIPSNVPIKSIVTPIPMPPVQKLDSIKKANPIYEGEFKTYDQLIATEKILQEEYKDTLKPIITFNVQNPLIEKHFPEILKELDASIDLSNFTISRYRTYATPTFHITYSKDHFDRELVQKIARIIDDKFKVKTKISAISEKRTGFPAAAPIVAPRIGLGGIFTKPKIRVTSNGTIIGQ